MYYCHLCRQGEDENSIVKHCTRYLHLFRYWVSLESFRFFFITKNINFLNLENICSN